MHISPSLVVPKMIDAERAIQICERKQERRSKVRSFLCAVVLGLALLIIGILAIPTFLLIGAIAVVWCAADYIIRWIEKT